MDAGVGLPQYSPSPASLWYFGFEYAATLVERIPAVVGNVKSLGMMEVGSQFSWSAVICSLFQRCRSFPHEATTSLLGTWCQLQAGSKQALGKFQEVPRDFLQIFISIECS